MPGFILWCLVSCVFVGIGISCLFAKKPVGFWANIPRPEENEIKDVTAYNRAMCKLWCIFGGVMMLLGLPLLTGQNSPLIIISMIGLMIEVIVTVIVYLLGIEKRYQKK